MAVRRRCACVPSSSSSSGVVQPATNNGEHDNVAGPDAKNSGPADRTALPSRRVGRVRQSLHRLCSNKADGLGNFRLPPHMQRPTTGTPTAFSAAISTTGADAVALTARQQQLDRMEQLQSEGVPMTPAARRLRFEEQQRHQSERSELERRLREHHLEAVPMPSDGDCLFHALSSFYSDAQPLHCAKRMRASICDYIAQNPDTFRVDIEFGHGMSVEQYVAQMRVAGSYRSVVLPNGAVERRCIPGTWGDATCLSAFCMMNDVNVWLFTPHGVSELYPAAPGAPARPKLAVVAHGMHYESTRLLPLTPAPAPVQ